MSAVFSSSSCSPCLTYWQRLVLLPRLTQTSYYLLFFFLLLLLLKFFTKSATLTSTLVTDTTGWYAARIPRVRVSSPQRRTVFRAALSRRDFVAAFCPCSLHRTHFATNLTNLEPPPTMNLFFQRLSWAVTQKVQPWLGLTTESWPLYLGNTGPEHICIQPRLCAHIVNGRRPDSWRWMKLKPSLITSLSPQGGCSTALLCHLGPCTVSILTQAFHFHAFIFITRQTFPASLLSEKHLSLFSVPAFLILFHYNHPAPSSVCVCVCACVCVCVSLSPTPGITYLNDERE